MHPRIIILFLLLFPVVCVAQTTISGTIQAENGTPIEFANVALMDTITNQFIAGTTSDERGFFELTCSKLDVYQISVQYVGYEKWTQVIDLTTTDLGTIILKTEANELDEIVVTAERPIIERKDDKIHFNITSSPLKQGYDGMEVLERAPNIWVDGEDNIAMRNGRPNILINGRTLNMSGEALTSYIRNIPSENIQRIEIQTNPAANSDANNLGGVVNIILKKKPLGFNATLRSNYEVMGGGFYVWNNGFNANYGAKNWNVYGTYGYRRRDVESVIKTTIDYKTTNDFLETDLIRFSENDFHRYQLGAVFTPLEKHEFGAEVFGYNVAGFEFNDVDLQLSNAGNTIDFGTTDVHNDFDSGINSAVLNYTWHMDTLNSNVKIIADRTQQATLEDMTAISRYNLGELADNDEKNDFDSRTTVVALQADMTKNFSNGLKLETGVKQTNTDRNNDLFSENLIDGIWELSSRSSSLNYQENISAAYATATRKFQDKHTLKLGVRLENTDLTRLDYLEPDTITKNYKNWFPSAYYGYDLTENSSLSANYSRRIGRPSFRDLNKVVRKINDFRYAVGNPDLLPQYYDQFELTYNFKKQSVSAYYVLTNDAINGVYFIEDGIAYYQRQNAGSQTQYGLEYEHSGKLTDWWSFRGGLNLYNRKFTTDAGEDLFQQATFDVRLTQYFKLNETTGIDLIGRYLSPTADAYYYQIPYNYVTFMLKKSFLDKRLNCRIYCFDIFNIEQQGNNRPFPEIETSLRRKNRTRAVQFWVTYDFATKNKARNKKASSSGEGRRRL